MDDKTGFETAHDEADALRTWAEDEQRKREAVEEDRLRERQKNDHLLAVLKEVLRTQERWGLTSQRMAAYRAACDLIKQSGDNR